MILIEKLNKPYNIRQRIDFVSKNMQFQIIETDSALEVWDYTDEEKAQREKEYINQLSLTKREVFLALYKDKGITPEQIKAQIQEPEALIEFEYANDYFRGNPLIDLIGQTLGYTSEQLDYLFLYKELPIRKVDNEV